MPSDPVPADLRPRHRLPMGVLGMIALVACVEAAIMRHDYDLTTLVASNWEIEGRATERHAVNAEILVFGDSMVKFGIQPKILSAGLGKSAYNFALYCGPPQASYYLLDRAFDAGAKPAAILVDFQPEFLAVNTMNVVSRTFPELLSMPEALDLCWNAQFCKPFHESRLPPDRVTAADRLAELAVAKLLSSARKRFEVRAAILAAIQGESASIKDRVLAAKRNWKLNRGAEVLPKFGGFDGHVPESGAYPAMFWTPWKPNDLNLTYVHRFLELAKSRDVPVFWVIQPNVAEVDARREQVGYNAQYEAFVRDCQATYPNLNVIDGRHVNYPTHVFNDPVHLDRQGATAETLGIVDVLKAYFKEPKASPRWALLPDRRDNLDAIRLEDRDESGIILKAELDKVRR